MLRKVHGSWFIVLGWIFPPTPRFQEIHLPISIDVTDAKTMGEFGDLQIFCDGDKRPFLGRFGPVRGEPTEPATCAAHDLRFAVACDVGKDGRFVVHHVGDDVHGPRFVVVRAGVQVKTCFFAWEAEDENVVLLIGIEVVDVGKEVVGVAMDAEDLRLVVSVLRFKCGAFPPEWTGDHIGLAVAIDVADGGTFGIKVTVKLLAFPCDLCGSL